jgi:hypothetical protein
MTGMLAPLMARAFAMYKKPSVEYSGYSYALREASARHAPNASPTHNLALCDATHPPAALLEMGSGAARLRGRFNDNWLMIA